MQWKLWHFFRFKFAYVRNESRDFYEAHRCSLRMWKQFLSWIIETSIAFSNIVCQHKKNSWLKQKKKTQMHTNRELQLSQTVRDNVLKYMSFSFVILGLFARRLPMLIATGMQCEQLILHFLGFCLLFLRHLLVLRAMFEWVVCPAVTHRVCNFMQSSWNLVVYCFLTSPTS